MFARGGPAGSGPDGRLRPVRPARRRSRSGRRTTRPSSSCCRTSRPHGAAQDLNALRALVTPEMLSYFAEQLADQTSRGVRNEVTDVRLLQGDLSQAWSEGSREYATVAMRFSMIDVTRDATGRIVDGSPTRARDGDRAVDLRPLAGRAVDPVGDPAGALIAATCGARSAAPHRAAAPRFRRANSRAVRALPLHPARTSAAAGACRPGCATA